MSISVNFWSRSNSGNLHAKSSQSLEEELLAPHSLLLVSADSVASSTVASPTCSLLTCYSARAESLAVRACSNST